MFKWTCCCPKWSWDSSSKEERECRYCLAASTVCHNGLESWKGCRWEWAGGPSSRAEVCLSCYRRWLCTENSSNSKIQTAFLFCGKNITWDLSSWQIFKCIIQYCYMWNEVLFAFLALLTGNGKASLQLRKVVHIYGDWFGLVWFNHFIFLRFAVPQVSRLTHFFH